MRWKPSVEFENNEQAAEDGKTALAYFKQRYITRYEAFNHTDDLPMTEKEKVNALSEHVNEMTLDALIEADQKLSQTVLSEGLRMNSGASTGKPAGYTRSAVS